MTDYIRREDALKALFAPEMCYAPVQLKIVKEMPAADVAEVVYCKECEHKVRTLANGIVLCSEKHGMIRPSENDFCSYGERAAAKTSENGGTAKNERATV